MKLPKVKFNKIDFKQLGKSISVIASKKEPELLIAAGITSFISAIVLAVRATPRAVQHIEEKKEELDVDKLSVKDTISVTWKDYAWCVLAATGGTVCTITGAHQQSKRLVAAATACSILQQSHDELRSAAQEALSPVKQLELKDKEAQNAVDSHDIPEELIINPQNGKDIFLDSLSGRYFYSTYNTIHASANEYNKRLLNEFDLTTNEWFSLLDLEDCVFGEFFHYTSDRPLDISVTYAGKDGKPVGVILYPTKPACYSKYGW